MQTQRAANFGLFAPFRSFFFTSRELPFFCLETEKGVYFSSILLCGFIKPNFYL
jgi:hypothetical protein